MPSSNYLLQHSRLVISICKPAVVRFSARHRGAFSRRPAFRYDSHRLELPHCARRHRLRARRIRLMGTSALGKWTFMALATFLDRYASTSGFYSCATGLTAATICALILDATNIGFRYGGQFHGRRRRSKLCHAIQRIPPQTGDLPAIILLALLRSRCDNISPISPDAPPRSQRCRKTTTSRNGCRRRRSPRRRARIRCLPGRRLGRGRLQQVTHLLMRPGSPAASTCST